MNALRRYRKRPIEVEALQWTGGNLEAVREFAARYPGKDREAPQVIAMASGGLGLWIEKSQVWRMDLPAGDWVIAEADGVGVYPCTDREFQRTYEAVD